MEDRFKGLVDELALQFNQKTQQLEQTEARLMEEQVSLELEKKTMAKVPVADNDIVDLNVGGRLFTTRRASLTQVKGSVLELLFTGRWEDRVDRDATGNVFLDYDPDLFNIVLRFLAAKARYGEAAENLALRPVPWEAESEFRLMLKDLALDSLITPSSTFRFSPTLKTKGVTLSEDGDVAICSGQGHVRHQVFSEDVYSGGVFRFQIKLESFDDWVMVGIISDSTPVTLMEDTCTKETAYGWGSNREVFVHGQDGGKMGYPGFKLEPEMEVEMILDCRYNFLELLAPVDNQMLEFKIPNLTREQEWRVQVTTYYGASTVSIACR